MDIDELVRLNRLALYAGSGEFTHSNPGELVATLAANGFVGDSLDNDEESFYPGERFIEFVTFLGCSPSIALSPDEGPDYCLVHIAAMTPQPRLHMGMNTLAPKCSRCAQVRNDWQHCERPDYCSQCNLQERQHLFAWRRRGLLSRWVITLANIYPHEAVPTPQLMTLLADVSGQEWGYAYLQAVNK